MRGLLRVAYAPAMLVGFIGGAIWLVATGRPAWVLAPLLVVAIVLSFLAERAAPYEPEWNQDQGDRWRDVLHAIVNEASYGLSLALVPALTLLAPFSGLWPHAWPLWVQVLMAIVVADAGITLAHYLSHKIEWLWRFHAVHHSVKRLYGFNGLMKHPLHQAIETTAGATPLILAGMPLQVGVLLGFAVAIQLLLQHSNVDMRIGPLRHVLALAPVHRFHHQRDGQVGDVNFGLFTTVWDRLLGTAMYDARRRVGRGDVGIGDRPDYPVGYAAQLVEPFRKAPPASADRA
jgi:sterol desaturase/sphingolipid hydroxylase (fatty acid hydroxylase superfamily)